ncbi:MAG: M23 family metallopeptidase [Spirochaetia bacterium]
MKNRFYILMVLVCFLLFSGFQWPTQGRVITATFGESRWDHFHSGIDLGGGRQNIYAVDEGEVVYYYEEDQRYNPIPTGLGNFLVLQHQRGIQSLYAHLYQGSLETNIFDIASGDVIGLTGASGYSIGTHLHLTFYNIQSQSSINPLLLLPEMEDTVPPEIHSASLIQDEQELSMTDNMSVRAGSYGLKLHVSDQSHAVQYYLPMAPYSIEVYLNGTEVIGVSFETITENNGELTLGENSNRTFDNFYYEMDVFNLGEINLIPGENRVEFVAGDRAGNSSAQSFIVSAVR